MLHKEYLSTPPDGSRISRFVSEWTPERFFEQARAIDEDAEHYISKILENWQHPEPAYKCCAGIMALARKVGNERITLACRFASSLGVYGYLNLEDILNRRLGQLETQANDVADIPDHGNIRGKDYYNIE